MLPTKITVLGAGSASFGLHTIADLVSSEQLRGSHLALVDINEETLASTARLTERLNTEWGAGLTISKHTDRTEALPGAKFVVSAIEVTPREDLWRQDFEIPLKYGVRQPYAENGGPGGFAHAARNVAPLLEILGDMEALCPDAWFINFTNPMMRICDLVARYSNIKVVGLCHQLNMGYAFVGLMLADELGIQVPDGQLGGHADPDIWPNMNVLTEQVLGHIDIKAAGLNHFTWMLDIRDTRTGEDLYPRFAEKWRAYDPAFEPLTRRVFDAFGTFPVPGDEHLCEYLPWLHDPNTKPWEKYEVSLYDWARNDKMRWDDHDRIIEMGEGRSPIDALRDADSEGALDVILNVAGGGSEYHRAVNLPNQGQIANLPEGAIVETPAVLTGMGVQPMAVGDLPVGVAELCRREISVVQLCIDAAVHGDRDLALQCLLLDPVISDLDVAKLILDDYLESYREYLPQFWG